MQWTLRAGWLRWINYCLPRHCLLCLNSIGNEVGNLCRICYQDLPHIGIGASCQRCSLPLTSTTETAVLCAECINSEPTFNATYCPFSYETPIPDLINQIKHQGNFMALPDLINALLEKVTIAHDSLQLDAITVVPLHWRRQLFRGYNQASLIARPLSKALQVPFKEGLVQRIANTQPQQGLERKQRLNNLKDAFRCREEVAGLHLALVDDVVTTMATATAVSRCLLKAKAASVTLFCLARAPREIKEIVANN